MESAAEEPNQIKEEPGVTADFFPFPMEVNPNLKFSGVAEVRSYIKDEEIKVIKWPVRSIMETTGKPSIKNCKYIRVKCKLCQAHMNFKKEGDYFVLSNWNNVHEHQTKPGQTKIDGQIFEIFKEKTRLKLNIQGIRQPLQKQFAISKTYFDTLLRRFEDEVLNQFSHLSNLLNEAGYITETYWNPNIKDRYPRTFMAVSPIMKKNYKKWGEILCVDITDNNIKNVTVDNRSHKLVVFTVIDNNLRVLLVGMAIICQVNTEEILRLFRFFFKIHEDTQKPQTIITFQQQQLIEAMNILETTKQYTGLHVYEAYNIVSNIEKRLNGSPQQNKEVIKHVAKAIRSRTEEQLIDALTELKNSATDYGVFDFFVENINKICYMAIPRGFIGVRRFFNQRPSVMMAEELPYPISINGLIERLMTVDQRLDIKSIESFRLYSESVETVLLDHRVKDLRFNCEPRIFQRFLQNYFKALSNYKSPDYDEDDEEYDCPVIQIKHKEKEEVYLVRKWECPCEAAIVEQSLKIQCRCMKVDQESVVRKSRCECEEFDKTGIPCPHAICYARFDNRVKYSSLFNPRWLKSAQKFEQQVTWIKKGRAKSTRRQTHRKRIGNKA